MSHIFVFDQNASSILHALQAPSICNLGCCGILLHDTVIQKHFFWKRKMSKQGIQLIQLSLQGHQTLHNTYTSRRTCQNVTIVTHKVVPIFMV